MSAILIMIAVSARRLSDEETGQWECFVCEEHLADIEIYRMADETRKVFVRCCRGLTCISSAIDQVAEIVTNQLLTGASDAP